MRRLGEVIGILLVILLLAFNISLYFPQQTAQDIPQDVPAQLSYLEGAIDRGAAKRMQGLFPEGYFFTLVLYGEAQINYAETLPENDPDRQAALAEALDAISQLESPAGYAPFPAALEPAYGVFYQGWLAWLQGRYVQVVGTESIDEAWLEAYRERCNLLADAFGKSDTPYLQSYSGSAWPVDSVVGIAALSLHDDLFAPEYQTTIADWIDVTKQNLDPKTGLLPHRINPSTGAVINGTRGSSSSIINRFLPIIDEEWSTEYYLEFREQFVTIPFGVREYPKGSIGFGDIDSGPLVFGISASATVVTAAAAHANNDYTLAHAIVQGADAVGFPFRHRLVGGKVYGLGLLPVGETFFVWAKTTPALIDADVQPLALAGWRLVYHLPSSGIGLLLVWRIITRTNC